MRKNRWLILFMMCCVMVQLFAQDSLPNYPDTIQKGNRYHRSIPERGTSFSDVLSVHVSFPKHFTGTGRNVIVDSASILSPILEHLRQVKEGISEDTVRIVHIGDSHIRGHIYPQTTGDRLQETFGLTSYIDLGVNGATCLTFTDADRIADIVALKPELLILSFGTNESHNRRYVNNVHYQQIKELITLLRDRLPTIPILLTTPPGSYESFRQRRRRRTYVVNPRTTTVAGVIRRFAADHQLALWDMYSVVGGSQRACKNWQKVGMLRPDHVHYTPEGYTLQGELLYEALIKAYNNYVSH